MTYTTNNNFLGNNINISGVDYIIYSLDGMKTTAYPLNYSVKDPRCNLVQQPIITIPTSFSAN